MVMGGQDSNLEYIDWRDRAPCFQDPKSWDANGSAANKMAKLICRQCPVPTECLLGSLEEGDKVTIRAGTEPGERTNVSSINRLATARYRDIEPTE